MGPLVPAGRPAADPAPRRPAGPAARPGPAGVGGGDLPVGRGGAAAYAVGPARRRRPGDLRLVDRRAAAQRPLPAGMALPGPAHDQPEPSPNRRASDRMRAAGIVQRGAALLRQPARLFELPRDEATARDVVVRLRAALDRLDELHPFSKGVGLAAPQIGIPWAAAVVRPPDRDAEPRRAAQPTGGRRRPRTPTSSTRAACPSSTSAAWWPVRSGSTSNTPAGTAGG